MTPRWMEAGGANQFEFMGAASRSLRGERNITCPKCGQAILHAYFHQFNANTGRGTIWVWCPNCHTTCHLPRVVPAADMGQDSFRDLSLAQFEALERDSQEGFFDRLERLWKEGRIGYRG
jgi:hypothetical protein